MHSQFLGEDEEFKIDLIRQPIFEAENEDDGDDQSFLEKCELEDYHDQTLMQIGEVADSEEDEMVVHTCTPSETLASQ